MRSVRSCFLTPFLLFLLGLSVSGCSGDQDNSAEQNKRAELNETAAVESVADPASDLVQEPATDAASILAEVDATDKKEPAEEFAVCSMCGQKVPKEMAVYLDGKLLCAHCVPGAHDSVSDAKDDQDQSQTP